jgi:hypothetical protein
MLIGSQLSGIGDPPDGQVGDGQVGLGQVGADQINVDPVFLIRSRVRRRLSIIVSALVTPKSRRACKRNAPQSIGGCGSG